MIIVVNRVGEPTQVTGMNLKAVVRILKTKFTNLTTEEAIDLAVSIIEAL